MFGLSLIAFYLFAFLDLSSGVLRILIVPAYLFRALTGSLLYKVFPGAVDWFWLQEVALLIVYFVPLLVVDALAVRFNRSYGFKALGA
jgi:hypothetical protein